MFLGFAYVRGTVGRIDAWPGILMLVLMFAYPIGAPFAAIAGAVHAISAIWFRKASAMLPVVAAVIVNLPLLAIGLSSTNYGEFFLYPVIVFPASLVASFVCWRLSRDFLRMG